MTDREFKAILKKLEFDCPRDYIPLETNAMYKENSRLLTLVRPILEDWQRMAEAIKTLRNETKGTLSAHELAIRYDSGNSNWACLELSLKKADAAMEQHRETVKGLLG